MLNLADELFFENTKFYYSKDKHYRGTNYDTIETYNFAKFHI